MIIIEICLENIDFFYLRFDEKNPPFFYSLLRSHLIGRILCYTIQKK